MPSTYLILENQSGFVTFWCLDLTDRDDDLIELGKFVKTLKNVDKFEILPYHTMGEFKWRELGIPYKLEGVKPPTKERVQNAKDLMETESYQDYLKRVKG